ncbi:MAG: glycerate kinase [Elusimicrobia bacterium]|nr:glycerate kinase [Elusimicrobiota bacterium]
MKIVIAPDSFKECLSAQEVCRAIQKGIQKGMPHAQTVLVPLADGGEGTLSALLSNLKGKMRHATALDPLLQPIRARYGVVEDGRTALIEMAESSGLALVPAKKRNPMLTSSRGTGDLIRNAMETGCRKILLTLGGVATNDAGVGMAQSLGYRFLDRHGQEIPPGAGGLSQIARIVTDSVHPHLRKTRFVAACDVRNPLCGPNGSARVYGPQKGATPFMVRKIESALRHFSQVVLRDLNVSILHCPGGGAAGGAGAGAIAFLNAKLKSGVETVLEAADLERKIQGADLIITGEGKIDRQTLFGKAPLGVSRIARKYGVPVVALCGNVEGNRTQIHAAGLNAIFSISGGPISREESMRNAKKLLEQAAEEISRLIRTLKPE